MNHFQRVVLLVDMDCFYCQVEEKLDPKLAGKPIAVVQYNAWRGGGIIAVNYPAREKGVKRGMRGDEAKQKCPDIILAKVPEMRGKADLTKYRDAGKQVADVLQTFTSLLERASVDEAYLDITEQVEERLREYPGIINAESLPNTFVVGCNSVQNFLDTLNNEYELSESNLKLAVGGIITEEIRAQVFKQTGYNCSAGIAHNKILAKLVCGLHKPNKQTILPQSSIEELYKDLPIRNIKSLGGKFGYTLGEKLEISYMGELARFSEKELNRRFDEKTAKWLYNIARGIDSDPVTTRLISKSIGCCKRFPGKTALRSQEDVNHWSNELAEELSERLEKDFEENNRKSKQMTVSFTQDNTNSSRTHALNSYEKPRIAQGVLDVLKRFCLRADGSYHLTFLGISVGNFQDLKNNKDITSFFKDMLNNNKKRQEVEKPCELTAHLTNNNSDELNNIEGNRSFTNEYPKTHDYMKSTENHTVIKSDQFIAPKDVYTNFTESTEKNTELKKADSNRYSAVEIKETDQLQEIKNSSNYSTETEDLDEDTSNLIYLEDVISELELRQPVFRDEEQETSKAKSFFMNYFRNETLKHSGHKDSSDDEDELTASETHREDISEEVAVNLPNEFDIDTELCTECNKKIPTGAFVSHMDYHFALKMVRDEAKSYNNKEKIVTNEKKHPVKRQLPESKALLSFLQKDNHSDLNEENSEMCLECNKRIKFEDLDSHGDYHAAKKLHSELNLKSSVNKNVIASLSKQKEKNKKKVITNVNTLTSFFKKE